MSSESELKPLLASIPFNEDDGIRFHERIGTAEWGGEKIELNIDTGGAINMSYRGKKYRMEAKWVVGGMIDAINGTHHGKPTH